MVESVANGFGVAHSPVTVMLGALTDRMIASVSVTYGGLDGGLCKGLCCMQLQACLQHQ